ncbi:MAG: TraX family protein [Acetatifactor sp.]
METKKKGITGSTFKMVAIITMLIDHIAAVVLTRILIGRGLMDIMNDEAAITAFFSDNWALYFGMFAMRLIGRLGFPIFCYLLVEGFYHTRNVWKYASRLGIFALISEIPFNLALNGSLSDWNHQNVFFTLAIGLLVLIGLKTTEDFAKKLLATKSRAFVLTIQAAANVLIMVAGYLLADFLKTDYAGMGVMTIVVMYLVRRVGKFADSRKNRVLAMGAGCLLLTVMSFIEITAFFALIPAALYNNERGWKMKYFFYAFYPVHLFLLWLICYFMGMGGIAAV